MVVPNFLSGVEGVCCAEVQAANPRPGEAPIPALDGGRIDRAATSMAADPPVARPAVLPMAAALRRAGPPAPCRFPAEAHCLLTAPVRPRSVPRPFPP
jgi:hypothetical protein